MTSPSTSEELCDFCGLPVPGSWWSRSDSHAASAAIVKYCCFGCRVAAQVTGERGEAGGSRALLTRLGIAIFLSMNVMVFTMALWSQDVYGFDLGSEATATLTDLFRYICLLFSIPVLILLGQPLLSNAIETTRQGRPSIDLLLSVGILAAFAYSAVTVFRGSGHLYFEVVCMVLVLVTLGRWMEATGRQKANAALDRLERLVPETVHKVVGQELGQVPRNTVQSGDLLRVLPGERIPIDARVIEGIAQLDRKLLTGESDAVRVSAGEDVYSGSLVLDGPLTVRAATGPDDDTLARMLAIVRRARLKAGSYVRLADRAAVLFLPLVVVIAIGTLFWQGSRSGMEAGLLSGLSVLLVSCPCALGLATPLAVWTAMNRAAEKRILFRNGEALERLAEVRTVCLDKTGTLTTGQMQLAEALPTDNIETVDVLAVARSLARHSAHPLCRAIVSDAPPPPASNAPFQAHTLRALTDVREVPGRGVKAYEGETDALLLMGNRQWLLDHGLAIPERLHTLAQDTGGDALVVFVARDNSVLGAITVREELREDVTEVLCELKSMGLKLEGLTGDRHERAAQLAAELAIPVRGELLPTDKAARIEELKEQTGGVLMLGDGVNDAPALTAASVGLAMGCGTDLARDSAEICLLGNDLHVLPKLLRLSRATMSTVRWNLFWAFGYNTVGIGLAAAGKLNPVVAAMLMFASSLFVISNSLRVGRLGAPEGADAATFREAENHAERTGSHGPSPVSLREPLHRDLRATENRGSEASLSGNR
jgi:heavy metal translocating P-type ATPase